MWTAVTTVLIFMTLAVAGRGAEEGEIFPFFSFNLFSKVPEHRVRPSIYLRAVGDRSFDPPRPLLGSGYERGQHGVVVNQLARELLTAVRDDPDEAERLATALETNHLPERTVWSLSLEHFSPLERWRDGTLQLTDVAWFSTDGQPAFPFALDGASGALMVHDQVMRKRTIDGDVDGITERDGRRRVSGWAGDPETGALPKQVIAFVDGRFVALGGVGVSRPDIAAATGQPDLRAAGFSFFLPPQAGDGDLDLVAVFDDGAGLIPET